MEPVLILAYLLPIVFLAVFIGRTGKKFVIYLVWGFIAAIPAVFLENYFSGPNPPVTSVITLSPLIEEFFKALPIMIPALVGIRSKDRDILIYALASGIGFSFVENWGSASGVLPPVTAGIFLGVLARSFSTSLMHACTCGIIGYGIVLTRNFDRSVLPVLLFGFYTIAVTVHAIFNLYAAAGGVAGLIVDLILPVPLFLLLLIGYHIDIPSVFGHKTEV
jgi:RsiW-degrading membrane proteinase PrsW (M82 family)